SPDPRQVSPAAVDFRWVTSRQEPLTDRLLVWAAPLSVKLSRRQRRIVGMYALAMACGVGVAVFDQAAHLGLDGLRTTDWMVLIGLLAMAAGALGLRAYMLPRDRAGWTLLAAGLGLGSLSWLAWGALYLHVANPPSPNLADVLWLPFFPTMYVGLGLILGSESLGVRRDLWL